MILECFWGVGGCFKTSKTFFFNLDGFYFSVSCLFLLNHRFHIRIKKSKLQRTESCIVLETVKLIKNTINIYHMLRNLVLFLFITCHDLDSPNSLILFFFFFHFLYLLVKALEYVMSLS